MTQPRFALGTYSLAYHYSFHYHYCLWSGLYLHHNISVLGVLRQVSTPSDFSAWLGIPISQGSPTLKDSTPTVSSRALKFADFYICRQSLLRLPFRHRSICDFGGARTHDPQINLPLLVSQATKGVVVWTISSSK